VSDPFHDNVVLITGASSGIGKQLALQLADQGAWLSLAARSEDRLLQVAASCRERGARTLVAPTDVAHEDQCQALVERTVAEFGRLDTLINNAGFGLHARFDELPDLRAFEQVMQVNFMGSVYCTYHALPHLMETTGRIVGISSLAGRFSTPRNTAYCASKHALTGFYDSLRNEMRRTGVTVTAVYPSFVVTEFNERLLESDGTPRGERGRQFYTKRMMTAERCARLIIRSAAARKRQRVMTLGGKVALWVQLIAPATLDRVVRKIVRKWK